MEPTRKSAPVRRRKRKKVQARFYGFLVVLVLVGVGIVALITMLGGKDDGKNVPVSGTQNTFSGLQDVTSSANGDSSSTGEQTYGTLSQWLGDEGSDCYYGGGRTRTSHVRAAGNRKKHACPQNPRNSAADDEERGFGDGDGIFAARKTG